MEIIPDGVIDESLCELCFSTGLIFEHHIIIPPKQNKFLKKWDHNSRLMEFRSKKFVHLKL